MTRTDRLLCAAYGVLALVALVGTQWALVDFLASEENDLGAMTDLLTANPVVGFVGIDLGILALAAALFMVAEGRRLHIRWWGLYVVMVFLVAASVAFPLFLIARTRALREVGRAEPTPPAPGGLR